MKGFLSCLAALGWIGVVIYQMSPRRQSSTGRNTWLGYRNADGEYELNHERVFSGARGCDIHGPGASCFCLFKTQPDTIELREAADRAHRGGWVECPIHGPDCYRRREARRTGRSQTDEDLARDGDLRRRAAMDEPDYPHAHDEHGAGGFTQKAIDQANQAHTTGQVRCPIHGLHCGRSRKAWETGLSQTDQDVARRAVTNGAH